VYSWELIVKYNRRQVVERAGLLAMAAFPLPLAAGSKPLPLVFRCARDNDLYRVMTAGGGTYARYDSVEEAIAKAPRGAGVAILADGYPESPTVVTPALYEKAAQQKLRLYVEFPAALPGLVVGAPREAKLERAVVASDAFAPALERLRILGLHRLRFMPVEARNADIVMARVAGFDTAVYGLPEKNVFPLLFEHNGVLVATTKLSQFITARYTPSEAWTPVWKTILGRLVAPLAAPAFAWKAAVRPSYGVTEALPKEAEASAFRRGVAAYGKARLFVHSSWKAELDRRGTVNDSVAPMPPADWPQGDGSEGLLEGFSSTIFPDGTQPIRWKLRNDCMGEASFPLALLGVMDGTTGAARVAANLNDFIYVHSIFAGGRRADPRNPAYGLVGWTYPEGEDVYYGDDNARSLLGTIGAAGALGSDRWDEKMLRCLLANLRTTGKLGFRESRIDRAPLEKNGWRHYWNGADTNYTPHYEAFLWACNLWAYHKTGYKPFLDLTRNAIRMTMAAYPGQWHWTNGIQQERARMLLPLAWLVRVEDTPEHRGWLRKIANEVLRFQDACGAIREELGDPGKGSYGPPRSNEQYGEAEATLIQNNGDPLADMLYTSNFAFLGLHEAAVATREPLFIDAVNKLAAFFCRVQIRSESHPELDGWWYRAFEYKRWEYWASNADAGWGVWSTESGWTQSWITGVLGMRLRRTSLWDISAQSKIRAHLDKLLPEMFPEG
jgi:hypothetical protein